MCWRTNGAPPGYQTRSCPSVRSFGPRSVRTSCQRLKHLLAACTVTPACPWYTAGLPNVRLFLCLWRWPQECADGFGSEIIPCFQSPGSHSGVPLVHPWFATPEVAPFILWLWPQECADEFSEIIPCLDQRIHKKMGLHPNTKRMEHYERHCPTDALRLHCLVPPPKGYQVRKTLCLLMFREGL